MGLRTVSRVDQRTLHEECEGKVCIERQLESGSSGSGHINPCAVRGMWSSRNQEGCISSTRSVIKKYTQDVGSRSTRDCQLLLIARELERLVLACLLRRVGQRRALWPCHRGYHLCLCRTAQQISERQTKHTGEELTRKKLGGVGHDRVLLALRFLKFCLQRFDLFLSLLRFAPVLAVRVRAVVQRRSPSILLFSLVLRLRWTAVLLPCCRLRTG